jgi:hypothetical protein
MAKGGQRKIRESTLELIGEAEVIHDEAAGLVAEDAAREALSYGPQGVKELTASLHCEVRCAYLKLTRTENRGLWGKGSPH